MRPSVALILLVGAASCWHTGGEGERCRHSEFGVDCIGRLTCVEFDYECGLGPPFYPCQNEACLDCSDADNATVCAISRDADNEDEDEDETSNSSD
jgi:hypothetical protein